MEIENINNNTTIRHETLFGAKDIYLDETRKQENKNCTEPISTDLKKSKSDIFNKIKRKITLENTLILLPEGKEKIFLLIYAFLLPYISGLFFLFFYIAEANLNLFSSMLDYHSYFLTWCIGYEILMIITLLGITVNNLMIMNKKPINTLKLKTL